MKPLLRLGFVDYFKPLDAFFIDVLSQRYDVVRDDENPDYLIFCDRNFGNENEKFNNTKVRKIFYTGENQRPWNYQCHYALSYEHLDNEQFYRLPLYVIDNWVYTKQYGLQDIRKKLRHGFSDLKQGFCSFVVMNPVCQERNNMFHHLSAYKTVDSGGPLYNNIGGILPRDPPNFHLAKFDFITARKFNLCYENGMYPGYVTEKIYHALYCNTVPIYWGSPTIGLDFNIDAIISRHDFETDAEMIDYIIEVDNDDALYNEIVRTPIFTKPNKFLDTGRFVRWFDRNVYKGVL